MTTTSLCKINSTVARSYFTTAVILLLASAVTSEPVELSVEVETQFGDSVYVTAPHPLLGDNGVTSSVKLSPHAYPEWSAIFDLPAGVTLHPTVFLRADNAAAVGDPENGTEVDLDVTIGTPGEYPPDQKITLTTAGTVTAATVTISAAAPGFTPVQISMSLEADADASTFTATIPGEHVAWGRLYSISAGGQTYPANGSAELTGNETWWRHGQAFLYPPPPTPPEAPQRETFTFVPGDAVFRARTIRVELPRGYDTHSEKLYPVLYAEDGQNVFSPGGPFGSWDADLIMADLVRRGEIPEAILVGIDNTQDRIPEYIPEYIDYGDGTRGGAYLRMIRDELMPEIQSRYRVLDGPENTAHLGSSLGGVLGFEAANEMADTFGAVIAMSPSFWLGPEDFLERASRGPETHSRLWMDSGNSGNSNDGFNDTIVIRDALIQSGHVFGNAFQHTVGIGQQHNEAAWRTRTPDALRWLYRSWKAPDPIMEGWAISAVPSVEK